jgi:vacuolar-type H+-ATPase subunit F/Vma7
MNILFLPGCYYLSNSIFLAIAKVAKKHINIYFDTNDPGFSNSNSINHDTDVIAKTFDRIFYDTHPFVARGIRDSKNLFNVQQYKKRLHKNLEHFNPDVIIVSTDMGGHINRMINNWAKKNNVPYIVIQTAFLKAANNTNKDQMINKLNYILFNKILSIPLFRRQEIYGCEKKAITYSCGEKILKRCTKELVLRTT